MKKTFSILMVGLILMAEFVPISAALLETYMKATGLSTNSGDTNSDTPDLTYTAGTWVSATRVFTVASGNPVTDGVTVGRLVALRVDGGAAAVLIGRVSARDATTITLAATDLAGSLADRTGDCTLVMGGRYKGPDGANFIPFTLATTGALRSAAGDKLRVNAIGTFDWLQAYTFAANGPYIFEGMTATPGDGGKARWNGDTNLLPYNFVNLSGINDIIFKHHIMQGNGYLFPATNGGPSLINLTGTGFSLESCVISNTYRNAINLVGDGWLIAKSLFEHCNQDSGNGFAAIAISRSGVLEDSFVINQDGHASTDADGILFNLDATRSVVIRRNIIAGNLGCGVRITSSSMSGNFENNIIALNGAAGWRQTSTSATFMNSKVRMRRNIIYGNATYGIQIAHANWGPVMEQNAFGANSTAPMLAGNSTLETGRITLSGNPFVNSTIGDFDLNNTAGAGALLRAVGASDFPSVPSYSGTIASYRDIGPLQHQDTGGGTVVQGGSYIFSY